MIRQAMLFAAGEGQRMRPLTLHTPKPLLQAGGKSLIAWQLEKLAAAGIHKVVINTHYLADQLHRYLGKGSQWGIELLYSDETRLLDTGGGLLQALPLLESAPFVLCNADIWTDQLPALQWQAPCLNQLWLVENPAHHPQGDFHFDAASGQVHAQPTTTSQRYTFAGISLWQPEALSADYLSAAYGQPMQAGQAFALAPLLHQLIRLGKTRAALLPGRWLDVGTPARLAELQAWLA